MTSYDECLSRPFPLFYPCRFSTGVFLVLYASRLYGRVDARKSRTRPASSQCVFLCPITNPGAELSPSRDRAQNPIFCDAYDFCSRAPVFPSEGISLKQSCLRPIAYLVSCLPPCWIKPSTLSIFFPFLYLFRSRRSGDLRPFMKAVDPFPKTSASSFPFSSPRHPSGFP